MVSCLSTISTIVDENCSEFQTGLFAGGILAAGGIIVWAARYATRRLEKDCLLSADFVDQAPPGERALADGGPYEVLQGESEHYLRITGEEDLRISELNIRFIAPPDVIQRPVAPPESVRFLARVAKIVSIWPPELLLPPNVCTQTDDQLNGVTVRLSPPPVLGPSGNLVLKLRIIANSQWEGLISVQALDPDRYPRFARAKVRVADRTPAVQAGNHYRSAGSAATSILGLIQDGQLSMFLS